ncbi:MAG: helix-turn-helix domain-containing protein [Alphaproteobacteria bacterium]|jgi:DNA-binding XRE family transcriptional regulator|nr:helix-turn-helix domain-containing protein [Alphaproteobacteria bacterium]
MSKTQSRVYSRYSREAAALMGKMIRLHRRERKFTTQDLADRAGISRITLQKIEKGDMKCGIGIVFEVATLVGIKLFETEAMSIGSLDERIEDKIALLPKSIRTSKGQVKDDF